MDVKEAAGDMPADVDLLVSADEMLTSDCGIAQNMAVAIHGGRIVDMGPRGDMARKYRARETVDGSGKLLMPGLIDAHTHVCQQLLRGRLFNERPMIWTRILVPFESNLRPDEVHAGAMLAGVEMIRAGITCFADSGGPHMDQVAEAMIELGLRAVLSRSTMDTGDAIPTSMKESTGDAISRTEELHAEYDGAGDGRIRIWFALRQLMTSTPELVAGVLDKAKEKDTGIHIHLAEHRGEVDHCLVRYGRRPAEWLDDMGVAGDRLLAAHSVLLTDREVRMLAERGAHPVHCPRANLQSHGFPKATLFREFGAQVGMGSDGAAGGPLDLFSSMRLLYLACRCYFGLPVHDATAMSARDLIGFVTSGGAAAVRMSDTIGSIEKGKAADIILIDLHQSHLSPITPTIDSYVSFIQPADVSDVIVAGSVLMRDRRILCVDEEHVMARALEARESVFRRAGL
ncbi:MAG: amidohydrolase [Firmicutes bacterium]|nr:amidohydrolase [Bacillota bacterium]